MRNLLFVCSGNTCRSPLALAAWRALEQEGKTPKDVVAASAGLMASVDEPASKHAVSLARDWKQDLSTHRAQLLTPEQASGADWIAVMNNSHVFALREYLNPDSGKILLLGSFDSDGDAEILDPFGGSREGYETCAARIRRAVEKLATAIEKKVI